MVTATYQEQATKKLLRDSAKKGFTLIELLIAMAIIGVLMGGVVMLINMVRERAYKTATTTKLYATQAAISEYENEVGELPQTLDDLTREKDGHGPYVKAADLKDGWGIKLNYRVTPEGERPYELFSYGGSSGKRNPKNKWIHAK